LVVSAWDCVRVTLYTVGVRCPRGAVRVAGGALPCDPCAPLGGVRWSGRCRASERAVRTFFPDAGKKVFCSFLILLSAFLSWLLSLALPRLPRQPLRLQAHQHTYNLCIYVHTRHP
jgi:hypothetical protein